MDGAELTSRYQRVRAATERLALPLSAEDQQIQSMPDASPTKWHLAHTSWFFETFVLAAGAPGYRMFHPRFGYLFNSYYQTVGPRHERPQRGLLSRPSLAEIAAYRRHVDEAMLAAISAPAAAARATIVLGLHHEQQHQELILTDIKHALGSSPLRPAYRAAGGGAAAGAGSGEATEQGWVAFEGCAAEMGHGDDDDDEGGATFSFDNETPRHTVMLRPFALASRPVTCGEYLDFIGDGGYARPELWLADGWDAVRAGDWRAPLYWERSETDEVFSLYTLDGPRPLDAAEPVCHVSFYEADAYARWRGARLPTEAEWEHAAARAAGAIAGGSFVDAGRLHPAPAASAGPGVLAQLFGEVWQWTASPYVAYPGYRVPAGAIGEYNGKFMCNQLVLRGGSCFSPRDHLRPTYRNFFPAGTRWQMSGIRLARDG